MNLGRVTSGSEILLSCLLGLSPSAGWALLSPSSGSGPVLKASEQAGRETGLSMSTSA